MNGRSRQHPIFLSHSGHDKPFVRKLYNALRDAGYDPFFDTHSLPTGEPFPSHIFQNASACRLGVVVLSPNFLTSRWPMMELHSMHTSPSAPTILPLFFKVSPNDVKLSSPHFTQWRDAWQTFAIHYPDRVNLTEWETAVTNLSSLNGVVHKPDEDVDIFIGQALHHISNIVRPQLQYMVSHLTGCERLTQNVATLFERIRSSSHLEARAIGLHGVGGQGKTTICKLMIHHYAVVYAGRCTLIELPSGDSQEAHVLNQCKKALQQLTNISDGRIGRVDNLDQCLQLLQERVADLDVFVAIDNIWENHLEFAQRIVDVGFSKGSKILVTSRSGQVLVNLLKDSGSVRPLPSLNREEARQIFINSFNRNHCANVHLEESDVDEMTRCFKFGDQYHPLAISALGVALGKTDRRGWPATRNKMSQFLGSNDNVVTNAIRLNYDSIPEIRREMFLDVALIYIPKLQDHVPQTVMSAWVERYKCSRVDENFDPLHTWLLALYKGRMDECKIRRTLMQLTFDGLLEFYWPLESDARLEFDRPFECAGRKEVRVHELYTELAMQEGAASMKFLIDLEKDIKCAEVERCLVAFPSLKLLMASSLECERGWWRLMEPLPELRVLQVQNKDTGFLFELIRFPCKTWKKGKLRFMGWKKIAHEISWWTLKGRNLKWVDWKHTPHLRWLELTAVTCKDISQLSDLLVLQLERCRMPCRRLCFDRLLHLQFLEIWGIEGIEEITGLGSLLNLKCIQLAGLPDLRKVDKFSERLTQLQVVEIVGCDVLELDVEGLGLLPNLKALSFTHDCLCNFKEFTRSLQALCVYDMMEEEPNLRDMGALEFLLLHYKGGRSVLEIQDLPRLKAMVFVGNVKEIGYIGQVPSLEYIGIDGCTGLKEIDWSSFHGLCNFKQIIICKCPDLKKVKGDPSCIAPTLPLLDIFDCATLEAVAGLHMFKRTVTKCKSIEPPPREVESSILPG